MLFAVAEVEELGNNYACGTIFLPATDYSVDSKLWILVAEDDPNDALLLKQAFLKNGINNPTHICADGEDAIAYLQGKGDYSDRNRYPFPAVIFTDLKMPRRDGLQLLAWIHDDPDCKVIPIVVFSSSKLPHDVKKAYQLGANAYICKPNKFEELQEIIRITTAFWDICEKPPVIQRCS